MNIFKLGRSDFIEGLKRYKFWHTFALVDVRAQYKGSALGVLWIFLSPLIFIGVLAPLYSSIFDIDLNYYLLHLSIGFLFWTYIQRIINSSTKTFSKNKSLILQGGFPYSSFSLRLVMAEIYRLALTLIIAVLVFIYTGHWPGFINLLIGICGIVLVLFASFWVSIALAFSTLILPDLAPAIKVVTRMAFFATPIIWVQRDLGTYGNFISAINPFEHAINVIRTPLLGGGISLTSFIVLFAISLVAVLISLFLLGRFKRFVGYLV